MKNTILMILITLTLSSCAVNSLAVTKNQELIFSQGQTSYTISNTLSDTKVLGFRNIEVEQKTAKNQQSGTLFYEKMIVDINYELKYGSAATLKIIFDVSKSNTIYYSAKILFIQLELKNGKYINLVAETSGIQELSYIYGFSNKEFLQMIKTLAPDAKIAELRATQKIDKVQTEWSQEKLFIQPLIALLYGSRRI